jgi:hypothetical protein
LRVTAGWLIGKLLLKIDKFACHSRLFSFLRFSGYCSARHVKNAHDDDFSLLLLFKLDRESTPHVSINQYKVTAIQPVWIGKI